MRTNEIIKSITDGENVTIESFSSKAKRVAASTGVGVVAATAIGVAAVAVACSPLAPTALSFTAGVEVIDITAIVAGAVASAVTSNKLKGGSLDSQAAEKNKASNSEKSKIAAAVVVAGATLATLAGVTTLLPPVAGLVAATVVGAPALATALLNEKLFKNDASNDNVQSSSASLAPSL